MVFPSAIEIALSVEVFRPSRMGGLMKVLIAPESNKSEALFPLMFASTTINPPEREKGISTVLT
jgi:hypothetical protein